MKRELAAMDDAPASGGLGMSAGRLEAFSDGVLAIVITLLILDVKVPVGATGHLGTARGPSGTDGSRCSSTAGPARSWPSRSTSCGDT